MSAHAQIHPRVLVALPHARLRNAIAAALGSSTCISVIGTVGDLDRAVEAARAQGADGVVVGTGLLAGDLVTALRRFVARLPGVPVVVVGTESSSAYASALEHAGAAAYVSLQWGTDVLSTTVRLATAVQAR